MPSFRRFLPAAALGLMLVTSGCGGSPTSHREIAVVLESGHAAYEPTMITVDKDDNVVLAVGNSTSSIHGFSIEGYGIQTEIPPGGMEVKFKSVHPGTFKIYCQLHETHQIATLVVR